MDLKSIINNFSYIRLGFENQERIIITRDLIRYIGVEDIASGVSYDNQFKGERSHTQEWSKIKRLELSIDIRNVYPNKDLEDNINAYNIEDTFSKDTTTEDNEDILYRLINFRDFIDVDGIAFLDSNQNIIKKYRLPYNDIKGKEGNIDYNDNARVIIDHWDGYRLVLEVDSSRDFAEETGEEK